MSAYTTTAPIAEAATTGLWYPRRLDELHEQIAPGALVASPTGLVLASVRALPSVAGHPFARFGLAHRPASQDELSASPATATPFAAGLLVLHCQSMRRLLDLAITHLGARTSGGSDLLAKQLVQSCLADVAITLAEQTAMAEHVDAYDEEGGPAARWRSHRRLLAAGRVLAKLFGASGFLADGPGGELYAAEAVGNVYLHPGTEFLHG
ncbi:hypothetical protein KGQ20_08020 [Catenulispora sp. NF23]|uniref:Acyl-CoA dehydrogenase/oxidase C-terminal domain-containing protein n=1 Tax=Catenulispora pinistramenti TaxID=2705254 RepID=A0ABS5KPA1_9ACTN|nr:acyl-CoA dehydrogenase family protein [Catenulispora pinistramenti]MBS2532718.1 hypothetical protein [Catenulispora pinistramenti]MBS2547865.1 hypothetical protein [Catenulispora pinistramenti]